MGKDASEKKVKDKKEKKEKKAEADGVTKVKKDKKDKKSRKSDIGDKLEDELEKTPEDSLVKVVDGDVTMADAEEGGAAPLGALVPFALPLCEEQKDVKKILKTVKKCTCSPLSTPLSSSSAEKIMGLRTSCTNHSTSNLANAIDSAAKTKTLRRGVKEVVKALRKSAINGPSSSGTSNPSAICIIAADISPMDVISHIPVLCEDHNIPYIYVRSRAELGEASATKRPTSVVMVSKERVSKKAKDVKEDDVKEFEESFGDLVKLVSKASKGVKK